MVRVASPETPELLVLPLRLVARSVKAVAVVAEALAVSVVLAVLVVVDLVVEVAALAVAHTQQALVA